MAAFLAALPWVASAVGSMLPIIADSFSKGRTPEEAAAMLAPKRAMLLKRFTDTGMTPEQAGPIVDQLIQGEMANAQMPEHMSPFATATLSVLGALGGWKGGSMLASKLTPAAAAGATAAAVAAPVAAATVAAKPAPVAGPIPEFLPGEASVVPRAPAKSLAPWEGMPEVQAAMARKSAPPPAAEPRDPMAWADAAAAEASVGQRGDPFAWAAQKPRDPMAWADDVTAQQAQAAMPRRDPLAWADPTPRDPFAWANAAPEAPFQSQRNPMAWADEIPFSGSNLPPGAAMQADSMAAAGVNAGYTPGAESMATTLLKENMRQEMIRQAMRKSMYGVSGD